MIAKILNLLTCLILIGGYADAQTDSLLNRSILNNISFFKYEEGFSGKAWQTFLEEVNESQYVLIGEDHFIHEVPLFTQALIKEVYFDNYVNETDPWTLRILHDKISNLPSDELDKWKNEYANELSFFQKKPEFVMLEELVKNKINLVGIEQISLLSTTIIFEYLAHTGHPVNRDKYKQMSDSSKIANEGFVEERKPYFMKTDYFDKGLMELDYEQMNTNESNLVKALKRSAEIYKTGSHTARIQLMHENLLLNYQTNLKGKKNLFKFGANHPMKGESYLPVYDIGNTAHIMNMSEGGSSLHILILPKSGEQAGFIDGKSKIDYNSGLYKSLNPFFEASSSEEWSLIDLKQIRKELRKEKYDYHDPMLEKSIKGYDLLVVIPKATAAKSIGN